MKLNPQDLEALRDYFRATRRAARLGREPAPDPDAVETDAKRVRWRRLAVTHAAAGLPAGSYARAAFGGLQDSTPRSALLSLHARVDDVDPTA